MINTRLKVVVLLNSIERGLKVRVKRFTTNIANTGKMKMYDKHNAKNGCTIE